MLGLSDPLSPALCNFSALQTLILTDNSFSGHIPSCFGALRELKILDLSGNEIRSLLPFELSNLGSASLEEFSIGRNPTGGQILDWMGNFYSKLKKIDPGSRAILEPCDLVFRGEK